MDTTKLYIEMCEAAEEIQAIYQVERYNTPNDFYTYYDYDKHEHTWLPKQDQLQDMVWNDMGEVTFGKYNDRIELTTNKTSLYVNSFEQAWLVIYMVEIHNKYWDEFSKQWKDRN